MGLLSVVRQASARNFLVKSCFLRELVYAETMWSLVREGSMQHGSCIITINYATLAAG